MVQVWRKYTIPSKLDSFYMTGGMLVLFIFFLAAFFWVLGIQTLVL